MATGRSDYPNQVNNVLGFPFIFRGALDVRRDRDQRGDEAGRRRRRWPQLAKEDVPESVSRAYGGMTFKFGREYIIPKPFDRRVLLWVAPAVAEAAMESGVARKKIEIAQYKDRLETLLGSTYTVMRGIKRRVAQTGDGKTRHDRLSRGREPEDPARGADRPRGAVSPSRSCSATISACWQRSGEWGSPRRSKGVKIIRPSTSELRDEYAQRFFEKRQRKGSPRATP